MIARRDIIYIFDKKTGDKKEDYTHHYWECPEARDWWEAHLHDWYQNPHDTETVGGLRGGPVF